MLKGIMGILRGCLEYGGKLDEWVSEKPGIVRVCVDAGLGIVIGIAIGIPLYIGRLIG